MNILRSSLALGLACLLALAPVARSLLADPPATPATVKGSVHSIELPPSQHEMPAGPNLEAYNANCVICHTNRYVTMQPKFNRKTWEAEVTKMVSVYGAPIAADQQKLVVDYLMSVRGKEDAPTQPVPGGDSSATKK